MDQNPPAAGSVTSRVSHTATNGGRSPPLFHVVLHQPEIPNNTGNIGRTCVATACRLHLVHPLGFDLSEKARRRAGLDYWQRLDVREHDSWHAYLEATPSARRWLLTTHAPTPIFDVEFRLGDHLIFGSETTGLPAAIRESNPDECLSLPLVPGERSLNLATAVCVVVYEGIRQLRQRGLCQIDPTGRLIVQGVPSSKTRT